MNAGRLLAAQPGLTLSDPIVSVLWGVLVFGERVRTGWSDVLAAVSALVLAAAVLVLIRSRCSPAKPTTTTTKRASPPRSKAPRGANPARGASVRSRWLNPCGARACRRADVSTVTSSARSTEHPASATAAISA